MQLELFGKGQIRPRPLQVEEIAECCWAGYRAGMSLTEIAAQTGVTRREAAGLALVYRDDDLCAILHECNSISTFFEFLGVSPKIRETVLGLLKDGKITKRLIEAAKRKLEKKPVMRRLKLVRVSRPVPDASIAPEDKIGDESGFMPGFFNPVRSSQDFFEFVT